jgi:hypothetical protein
MVTAACEEVKSKVPAGTVVYCPPVVPNGTTSTNLVIAFGKAGYMLDFGGNPEGTVKHWLVTGTSFKSNWRLLTANGEPDQTGTTTVAGTPIKIFAIHGYQNQNEGHVVYLWSHKGVSYLVSVHGLGNGEIARGMAEGLIREMD